MKILAVDDEAEIRNTLRKVLELDGHEVVLASDGQEALEKLGQLPDLILCDLNMPRLDGIEVLKEVRRRSTTQHVQFIIVTAKADRSEQRRAMEAGADDFVTKPFTVSEVLAAIDARVERVRPVLERLNQISALHQQEAGSPWDHELLTPLSGIFGGAELLINDASSLKPDEIREIGELILISVRRAENLSRKLICHFALERIALGMREVARGESEAPEVINRVAEEQARRFGREKDLGLAVSPGTIEFSPFWLSVAVQEIVENAFKFTEVGSVVVVNGIPTNEVYTIEISDHGPGMTPEQIGSMGAFRQFDRSKRQQSGLGLGLSIARRIIEFHGGQFRVGATLHNAGLRVTIAIPVRNTEHAPRHC